MHQRFTVPIDDQNWHQGTPPAGHETLVSQEGRGEGCDATRSSDTAAIREQVQTIAALRQINAYLAKFVPQTMQRLVAVNPTAPALSKCERDVSVLFLRISSAAALRERLDPGTRNRQMEYIFQPSSIIFTRRMGSSTRSRVMGSWPSSRLPPPNGMP